VIENLSVDIHYSGMSNVKASGLPKALSDEMSPENIGRRLGLIRKAYGLKPSEIADILDIERTYWSRFEGGKRAITDTVAAMLVDRFGVTLDFLILGKWDRLPYEVAEKIRAASKE